MRLIATALLALELLQPFRPAAPYGPGHRGIDLRASGAVAAPTGGVVAFAGQVGGIATLVIELGAIRVTMQPVRATRSPGTWVRAGEVVGQVAPSDRYHCQGCLHIGVRISGEYVDPLRHLPDLATRLRPVGRSVWTESAISGSPAGARAGGAPPWSATG